MNDKRLPKVAVIGAGWSGLAAAAALAGKSELVVFEAGKTAGGRARSLGRAVEGFSFLDNGQHIMLGAYHAMQTLMKTVGVDFDKAFMRLPLQWYMADGLRFQTGILPAPWHIVKAVLFAKGISFGEKIALSRQMRALQLRRNSETDKTVAQWLREWRVSRRLQSGFWQPLVLGALNTPLTSASVNTLANVLQDGVCAGKAAGNYWLPKQDLGALLAEPALAWLKRQGVGIRMGERVGRLQTLPGGRVTVNGEAFDAVVTAVAPYHAAALWPKETPSALTSVLDGYAYHAITTVYLCYAEPVKLPAALTGFAEGTAQWLLARGGLGGDEHEVAAVISVSDALSIRDSADWMAQVHADVKRVCPDIGEPLAGRVITEKRATVASTPNRQRPDCAWLHHQNIYPAGDYLHERYPATLEAAVQSGQAAAALLLADWRR